MHQQVLDYCTTIKNKFPERFKDKKVLEVGSLDINWSVRQFFENCDYTWIDLWEWPWVDLVLDITEELLCIYLYDTIISTEMLEHCRDYKKALINMTGLLKSWWLLLITCATIWRWEHWTAISPESAPFTNDHYKNIVESDFNEILPYFNECEITTLWTDIRFYWIKR